VKGERGGLDLPLILSCKLKYTKIVTPQPVPFRRMRNYCRALFLLNFTFFIFYSLKIKKNKEYRTSLCLAGKEKGKRNIEIRNIE
jgi:hypothetical protein